MAFRLNVSHAPQRAQRVKYSGPRTKYGQNMVSVHKQYVHNEVYISMYIISLEIFSHLG